MKFPLFVSCKQLQNGLFPTKITEGIFCCTVLTSVADGPITASAAYNFVGIEVGSLFHKSFTFWGFVRIFPPFSNFIDHFLAFQCQHTQFEKRS